VRKARDFPFRADGALLVVWVHLCWFLVPALPWIKAEVGDPFSVEGVREYFEEADGLYEIAGHLFLLGIGWMVCLFLTAFFGYVTLIPLRAIPSLEVWWRKVLRPLDRRLDPLAPWIEEGFAFEMTVSMLGVFTGTNLFYLMLTN